MNNPAFSVIIPAYNRAEEIGETIASVLAQTVSDYEIIVVDDGSSDDIQSAIEAIQDPRVRLISQKNGGANKARNTGIDAARGRYVALLDSDDKFLPHHLEAAERALADDENLVVYAKVIVDRGGGKSFLKPPRAIRSDENMATYLLCDRGFLQTSTLAMRRGLAQAVRYREGLPYGQDTDFAIRLFNYGARFRMLEQPSAIWLDVADPRRVSAKTQPDARVGWLEDMRGVIPASAYHGDRGWFVAKGMARTGRWPTAVGLYLNAFFRGCYSPKLALVVAAQVVLPPSLYRYIADKSISAPGAS